MPDKVRRYATGVFEPVRMGGESVLRRRPEKEGRGKTLRGGNLTTHTRCGGEKYHSRNEQRKYKQQRAFRYDRGHRAGRSQGLSNQLRRIGGLQLGGAELGCGASIRTEPRHLGLDGKNRRQQAQYDPKCRHRPVPGQVPTSHSPSLPSSRYRRNRAEFVAVSGCERPAACLVIAAHRVRHGLLPISALAEGRALRCNPTMTSFGTGSPMGLKCR